MFTDLSGKFVDIFYVIRELIKYFRLSAPYYVTLLTYTYLFGPIMRDMPLTFTQSPILQDACKKYWWKNYLYLINVDVNHIVMRNYQQ